jgi:hypothetical protein
MKLTETQYKTFLSNPSIPTTLKQELKSSIKELWTFVGTDFSGAENVVLSELLYPYDNGNLDRIINEGRKEDGTDLHSLNAKAMGISRGDGKAVWFGKLT